MLVLCAYSLKTLLFFLQRLLICAHQVMAGWQSGHAADCNSVYAGSIPTSASKFGNARVVKSVDTGDLKSPAHKACQFESGLGHHFSVHELWCKKFQRKLVFLWLQYSYKPSIKKAKHDGLALLVILIYATFCALGTGNKFTSKLN